MPVFRLQIKEQSKRHTRLESFYPLILWTHLSHLLSFKFSFNGILALHASFQVSLLCVMRKTFQRKWSRKSSITRKVRKKMAIELNSIDKSEGELTHAEMDWQRSSSLSHEIMKKEDTCRKEKSVHFSWWWLWWWKRRTNCVDNQKICLDAFMNSRFGSRRSLKVEGREGMSGIIIIFENGIT